MFATGIFKPLNNPIQLDGISLYSIRTPNLYGPIATAVQNAVDTFNKSAKTKNMKPRNLTLAIFSTIGSFHEQKLNFSAHDVTKALRGLVADNAINITDVPVDFDSGDGVKRARVAHDNVRQIVRDAFEDGLVPDYVTKHVYKGGVTYTEYQYPGSQKSVDVAPVVTAPLPPQTLSDGLLETAVSVYLDRKLTKGEQPTLKRIQSRLKRTPVTCDEVRTVANKLGYQIDQNVSAPSLDRVIAKY